MGMLRRPTDLKSTGLTKNFTPHFIAASVLDIDFEYLASLGIKAALIDLDGTVVARSTYEVNPEIRELLKRQPLKMYIATNRPKSRDLKDLKERLNANGVIHPVGPWGKPFPRYFAQAARDHGLKPEELVMIGDRYLQDIFGANLAGFRTIVVRKLDQPTNIIDQMVSWLERRRTDRLSTHYLPING
jgi:HAD superfamily phosphatase (TIGR01668 family)